MLMEWMRRWGDEGTEDMDEIIRRGEAAEEYKKKITQRRAEEEKSRSLASPGMTAGWVGDQFPTLRLTWSCPAVRLTRYRALRVIASRVAVSWLT